MSDSIKISETFEIIDPKQIEEFIAQLDKELETNPLLILIALPQYPNRYEINGIIEFHKDHEDYTDAIKTLVDPTSFTRHFVTYLRHKRLDLNFTGYFKDYVEEYIPEFKDHIEECCSEIFDPFLTLKTLEEKEKQEEIQLDRLVDSINSSMTELVSRAASLHQDERKKLLAKLNIPVQLLKREYVLEFNDTDGKARRHPTVTVIQSSDDQVFNSLAKGQNEPINILEKITEDLNNLRNPIIFAAIQRWIRVIRYQHIINPQDVQIAKKHLERLFETIQEHIKNAVIKSHIAIHLKADFKEIEVLKQIWEILKSKEVQSKNRKDEKMRQFYQKLGISEDGVEGNSGASRLKTCIDFVKWLASNDSVDDPDLPSSKPFKISWGTFKYAFLKWRFERKSTSTKSMKESLSRARSALTRGELQQIFNDPLYKTGHFDGNDLSLKHKKVTIIDNPTTYYLHYPDYLIDPSKKANNQ